MNDYTYSVRLFRADGSQVPVAVDHPETIDALINHGFQSGEFVRAVVKQRVAGGWVRLKEVSKEFVV